MSFTEIIQDIQDHIVSLQERLNELKSIDMTSPHDILLTRQEAADLLGKSTRQLDRDCRIYGIRKEYVNNGIRIRKSEILKHMGLLNDCEEDREELAHLYRRQE